MAKFTNIFGLEDKMWENVCKEQAFSGNRPGTNILIDKTQEFEKTVNAPEEELAVLLQEKLQLHEKGRELETIVFEILEESLNVIEKREKQEKALDKTEKNEKHVPDLIQSRVSEIYAHCKKFEHYFERALDSKRNKFRNILMLSGKAEVTVEKELALAESMFTSFIEQVSKIELLMKHDYNIIYHEYHDCFNIVMRECSKVEDHCNKLLSVLFDE